MVSIDDMLYRVSCEPFSLSSMHMHCENAIKSWMDEAHPPKRKRDTLDVGR